VSDLAKVVLILAAISGGLYLATRSGKRRHSAWSKVQPGDEEPAGTGVDFNPAYVSTAATSNVLVTGEPESGNIVTGSICPGAHASRPKSRGGCC